MSDKVARKRPYFLSIPDDLSDVTFPSFIGECQSQGCGSSEYYFETKARRDLEAKNFAKKLRAIADQFDAGFFSGEDEEGL